MILLWLILGIILAVCIARMNKSNKLFWILFTSFMVGIAGSSVLIKALNHNSEDNVVKVENSTQVNSETLDTCLLASDLEDSSSVNPNLVSRAPLYTNNDNSTTSKGYVSSQTQPPRNHKRLCTVDSTTPAE